MKIQEKKQQLPLPSSRVELIVTQNCNMDCKYCFEKNKKTENLNFEETLNFLQHYDPKKENIITVDRVVLFGGEPLLNVDFFEDFLYFIQHKLVTSEVQKKDLIKSIINTVITNGTLVDKHLDFIKNNNIRLQISLDGPEKIHNQSRTYLNGKGTFNKIYQNIKLLRKNNIPYYLHGVLSTKNYEYLTEICKFYLEDIIERHTVSISTIETIDLKKNDSDLLQKIIGLFGRNIFMIVVEEDIQDSHIDTLLHQVVATCEFFMETPLLERFSIEDRLLIVKAFLLRKGSLKESSLARGSCAAGRLMFCYNTNYESYACHRLVNNSSVDGKEDFKLIREKGHPSYKTYYQIQEASLSGDFYSNGSSFEDFKEVVCGWRNWCISTNLLESNNPFYIPAKYDILMKELDNLVSELIKFYKINLNN